MNNYRRGANLEYRIKQVLEEDGAVVCRSAGSHGAFDLIAIYPNQIRLIQLKRVKGDVIPTFKEDLDRMRSVKCPEFCTRELMIWQDKKGIVKAIHLDEDGEICND